MFRMGLKPCLRLALAAHPAIAPGLSFAAGRPLDDPANLDGKSFAMRGPMRISDPRHTPVRGDLADIRLAGHYFVPHYAVPMPRVIAAGGAPLLAAARDDAESLESLAAGTVFAVLDIAGAWAWGQAQCREGDENGPVGYVSLDRLETPS